MFGHQQDEHHDDNAPLVHDDVSAFTPAEPIDNPAASPIVGAPADDNSSFGAPADLPQTTVTPAEPVQPTETAVEEPTAAGNDDLLAIKQSALQELSPLVGHLEQSPEEKFRTTMMMIQASDDHSLVKAAYEAASQISDEKARAQALLDVVNEINYFTQHNAG